jgi:3-oxoacyl-[acyl-carrier protein] reductase
MKRRALVTGATGAIGSAIARALAADDFHVVLHCFRRTGPAAALCDEINSGGGSAEPTSFDVTDARATEAALGRILEGGPVQVAVSNAGIHEDAPMAGMAKEQWDRVIDVSLNGFFNVIQPLLLPMIRTRWGRIVAVSSISGILGNRGQTNYAAAKAGLHGAIRSLAREVASRGITANVVAPGLIAGSMTEQAFTQAQVDALVPMKRLGTPAEVGDLVAFLASDKASYVSGQIIGVNGGMI